MVESSGCVPSGRLLGREWLNGGVRLLIPKDKEVVSYNDKKITNTAAEGTERAKNATYTPGVRSIALKPCVSCLTCSQILVTLCFSWQPTKSYFVVFMPCKRARLRQHFQPD